MTENLTENEIIEVQENTQVDESVIYREVRDPYGFIYITTNLKNGMRYLGQKIFSPGWQNYLGSGVAIKKVIKEAKKNNELHTLHRDIVTVCYSDKELNQIEYDLSVFFDVVDSPDWYNLVLGGGTSRGWHPSEETKRKIGDKAKERLANPENHPWYGKPGLSGEKNSQYGVSPKERMDEETYKQWYEKHKKYWANPATKGKHIWADKPNPNLGKKLSKEQKENLSVKAKERLSNPENHPMYGRKQSDDAKRNMSNSRRLSNIKNGRTVYSVNYHRIFWGAAEVGRELHLDSSKITACCKGKQSYCGVDPITGEKLLWRYVIDAIADGLLVQEEYDLYVNKIKKEIEDYGIMEKE